MMISSVFLLIVPTLCVGIHPWTLCVRFRDAERPGLHSHAERGNDQTVDFAIDGLGRIEHNP
ncbi:hypothetical protein C1Y11_02885 [Pseudomonas sp. FW305-20]|nr:hypothetical protein PFAS1_27275 [Pseudomonas frederiksbergensis]PMU11933.1 hypothetical protein C1Y11_02885 [Pseudomonas sp. FW305-20]PMU14850.1 hypothetical protein C1Y10_24310 [Pseudomonas sp. FW305-122]PMU35433.1 hypothetical protein C1Y12_25445 [Pseudomonas sp. FW305-47B]PMX65178.1 hypothetical protein C1Y13_01205 [Pseudomonas sp. FW305-33]